MENPFRDIDKRGWMFLLVCMCVGWVTVVGGAAALAGAVLYGAVGYWFF